jgi:hypothetical protein
VASEANEALDGWLVVLDNSENTATATVSADALCAAAGKAVATPAAARKPLRRTREVRRIIARVKRG